MSFSVNRVTLLGNITRDPELRYTPKGTAVCTVSIATNRSVKDESTQTGWKDVPSFHRVIVWSKLGERVAQIAKGAKVYVEGRLDNRSYDAKDGTKRYVTEIIAEEFINCSPKNAAEKSPVKKTATAAEPAAPTTPPDADVPANPNEEEVLPDDIPF